MGSRVISMVLAVNLHPSWRTAAYDIVPCNLWIVNDVTRNGKLLGSGRRVGREGEGENDRESKERRKG